jgi:hypothetical protein
MSQSSTLLVRNIPCARRTHRFRLGSALAIFCGALMMSACSGSDPGSPGGDTDTGTTDGHIGEDTNLDTGSDTGSGSDGSIDSTADSGSDSGTDTGKSDTGKDTGPGTCPSSMPKPGMTCSSTGLSCPYGDSFCPIVCDCGTDLKWSCASTPCPPPPPIDGGPGPDIGPPPPPPDGGPSGCEDGAPCPPSSGCGSVCSSPAPPGSTSIICDCGTDGVYHCKVTPC